MNHQIRRHAAALATAPDLRLLLQALQACRDEISTIDDPVVHGVMDDLDGQIEYVRQEIEDAPFEAMADAAGAYADYRRDMDGDR